MLTTSNQASIASEHLPSVISEPAPRGAANQNGTRGHAPKNDWYQGYEMGTTFCRLTEELAARPGSKIGKEISCLQEVLRADFTRAFRVNDVNVVDLGTGDGLKTCMVISALREAGMRSVRYVPVDTNPHIARYASFTILGGGKRTWTQHDAELVFGPLTPEQLTEAEIVDPKVISIEKLVRLSTVASMQSQLFTQGGVTVPMTGLRVDFVAELARVVAMRSAFDEQGLNLFCLLGNTLGNYTPDQRSAFLASMYRQMRIQDRFLLGVSLRPPGGRILPEHVDALVNEHLPAEVFMRLGAEEADLPFRVGYDPTNCCMTYGFERSNGSVQDMGFSHLFDPERLVEDLKGAGLRVCALQVFPRISHRIPSRYSDVEPRYLTILAQRAR